MTRQKPDQEPIITLFLLEEAPDGNPAVLPPGTGGGKSAYLNLVLAEASAPTEWEV